MNIFLINFSSNFFLLYLFKIYNIVNIFTTFFLFRFIEYTNIHLASKIEIFNIF